MAKPFSFAPGIGRRLGELRGSASREEFAELVGVSAATIGNYERGNRKPDADFFAKVHEATGASLDWLITGRQPVTIGKDPAPDQVAIPRFDIEATACDGALVPDDRDDGAMIVDRDWLSRFMPPGRRVSMITARDESMEPVIRDGDVLLVEHDITEAEVRAGGVFVVTHHGGLKIKRLEGWDGGLRLSSDAGPRYGEEIIPDDRIGEDLVVHGRVFWTGGRLRDR